MKQRIAILLLLAFVAFAFPSIATAQQSDGNDDNSVLFRINGLSTIPAGDTVNAAIVINGDINIAGAVTDALVVINGTAIVTGTITGDITVVNGTLSLESGSKVEDVMLIDSDLTRADGATAGDIEKRSGDFSLGRGLAIFSVLWWFGLAIVGLVAAAFFAWIGREQLFGAVEALRTNFAPSLITALILWIALPIVAVLVVFTIIGAPLGISILVVLLPVLWLLGAVVIGAWIGGFIVKPTTMWRTIGSAAIGVLIIALISVVPFVAIIVGLAGMLGSGALVYRAASKSLARTPIAGKPGAA